MWLVSGLRQYMLYAKGNIPFRDLILRAGGELGLHNIRDVTESF